MGSRKGAKDAKKRLETLISSQKNLVFLASWREEMGFRIGPCSIFIILIVFEETEKEVNEEKKRKQ
jgi:hypothetical protein